MVLGVIFGSFRASLGLSSTSPPPKSGQMSKKLNIFSDFFKHLPKSSEMYFDPPHRSPIPIYHQFCEFPPTPYIVWGSVWVTKISRPNLYAVWCGAMFPPFSKSGTKRIFWQKSCLELPKGQAQY